MYHGFLNHKGWLTIIMVLKNEDFPEFRNTFIKMPLNGHFGIFEFQLCWLVLFSHWWFCWVVIQRVSRCFCLWTSDDSMPKIHDCERSITEHLNQQPMLLFEAIWGDRGACSREGASVTAWLVIGEPRLLHVPCRSVLKRDSSLGAFKAAHCSHCVQWVKCRE